MNNGLVTDVFIAKLYMQKLSAAHTNIKITDADASTGANANVYTHVYASVNTGVNTGADTHTNPIQIQTLMLIQTQYR